MAADDGSDFEENAADDVRMSIRTTRRMGLRE
jgi:hypothetical protein